MASIFSKLTGLLEKPPGYIFFRLGIHKRRVFRDRRERERDSVGITFRVNPLEGNVAHLSQAPAREQLLHHAALIRERYSQSLEHRERILGWPPVQLPHIDLSALAGGGAAEVAAKAHQRVYGSVLPRAGVERAARIAGQLTDSYRPIDWYRDVRAGFRWNPGTWYRDVRLVGNTGADVKIPWEIARFQHLPVLGLGYGLDRDERLVEEYRNQVLDFSAASVPRFGLHWSCAMEVAIRASNIVVAHDLFRQYGATFESSFESLVLTTLWEHGKHVLENLEWHPRYRNNHYLADLAGLVFVGSALRETCPDAILWAECARVELLRECLVHFLEDGASAEGSTRYHLLSLEFVLSSLSLPRTHASVSEVQEVRASVPDPLGDAYESVLGRAGTREALEARAIERLGRAIEFARSMATPGGVVARMGDNDSGRFLGVLVRSAGRDACDRDALVNEGHSRTDCVETLARSTGLAQVVRPATRGPSLFRGFGVAVVREGPWMVALRGRPSLLPLLKFHGHDDALSLTVFLDDREVVVDPGLFSYAGWAPEGVEPESRSSHAIPFVPGRLNRPAHWHEGKRKGDVLEESISSDGRRVVRAATRVGRDRLVRSVEVGEASVRIVDERGGAGPLSVFVPLAPEARIERGRSGVSVCVGSQRLDFQFHDSSIRVGESVVCPEYGLHVESSTITATSPGPRIEWSILLSPEGG